MLTKSSCCIISRSNSSGSLQRGLQIKLWNPAAIKGSIFATLAMTRGSVKHWHELWYIRCPVQVVEGTNGGRSLSVLRQLADMPGRALSVLWQLDDLADRALPVLGHLDNRADRMVLIHAPISFVEFKL